MGYGAPVSHGPRHDTRVLALTERNLQMYEDLVEEMQPPAKVSFLTDAYERQNLHGVCPLLGLEPRALKGEQAEGDETGFRNQFSHRSAESGLIRGRPADESCRPIPLSSKSAKLGLVRGSDKSYWRNGGARQPSTHSRKTEEFGFPRNRDKSSSPNALSWNDAKFGLTSRGPGNEAYFNTPFSLRCAKPSTFIKGRPAGPLGSDDVLNLLDQMISLTSVKHIGF